METKQHLYYQYLSFSHIQIMARSTCSTIYTHLYTSQRIFTSDMFWYGVGATCYPRYKFKHQHSYILFLSKYRSCKPFSLHPFILHDQIPHTHNLKFISDEEACTLLTAIHTLLFIDFFGITYLFRDYIWWLYFFIDPFIGFYDDPFDVICWSRTKIINLLNQDLKLRNDFNWI